MRSSKPTLSTLLAMAAIAAAGTGLANAMPAPRKGSNRHYKPAPPKRDTALQREIAEHNARIDERNAAKRDRRAMRKMNFQVLTR